jgi:excinuclease ABC subunit C
MKDWKNHIYIKIIDEIIPKVIKTRIKKWSWKYFWPYTSTWYINNILKFIKKNFWYRSCNIVFENSPLISHKITSPPTPLLKERGVNEKIILKKTSWIKIPCMDYYIGTCSGPCLLKIENIEKYKNNIEQIKSFLKWDTWLVEKKLEKNMLEKAKNLNFEEAEKIKKILEGIKWLNEYQIVQEWVKWDYNIVNFIEKFNKSFIWMIKIRDSKVTWFYSFDIKNLLWESIEEILIKFIENIFVENTSLPTPLLWKEKGAWKKLNFIIPFEFKEKINNNINIEVPKIWVKKDLLSLCYKNIYEYAYKSHLESLSTKGFTKKTMQNLLEILDYKQINKSIIFECNDISHISWSHTVASRSIIENWKSNTSKYKKFNINTLKNWEINDFWAMEEIIERRIKEIENSANSDWKKWFIPDLIVIDWWKWQLSSVVKICKKYWVELQLIWIAKREEEIFLPWKNEPIILDKQSNELRLIQKIRDEAHRFAITFNRDKRIKSMKKNILESLPWFGPITRKKLLKKYWNVDNLVWIEKDELLKIINKNQYDILESHWIV